MNVVLLEYFDYQEYKPPVVGLYVCKVACEASTDFKSDHIYMWAEWTGSNFNFGERWHLKPDEEVVVLGWAYSPEHSRMHDAPLVRAD